MSELRTIRSSPWIPMGCAIAAIAVVGFWFVRPALSEAERLDAERTSFENVTRTLRGVSSAAEKLMAERDRLRAEIDALKPILDAPIFAHATRDGNGMLHVELRGSFADVATAMQEIDRANGILVREFTLERQGSADELLLRLTLEPIASATDPDDSDGEGAAPANAPAPASVAGAAEEVR